MTDVEPAKFRTLRCPACFGYGMIIHASRVGSLDAIAGTPLVLECVAGLDGFGCGYWTVINAERADEIRALNGASDTAPK